VTAVVLIHGLIGRFADPRALRQLDDVAVLAPDLRGYGATASDGLPDITIERQADYVRDAVERNAAREPVHLVGHSVGGVIAADYAHRFPRRVVSFVNVEGNFTLADAFWSRQLAEMSAGEVHELHERDRSDPARWLADAGIEPTDERVRAATEALAFQPSTTVHATARAVVEHTGRSEYESALRAVFEATPVHLVAGARSRAGWDVPDWALETAASYTEIPDVGHMVMLEAPEVFGAVLARLLNS
jgi:lipase